MKLNLIDRVKLPFRKDKELYSSLYKILGFYPRNIEIYKTALAHKSSAFKTKLGNSVHNERLEFLGDAILAATVSDILYTHYPNKREGFLTSTRSKLVQRETLNQLATELGLDSLLKHSTHSNAHNSYLGGNAFEALVGAIYIDRGYERCKWFVSKRILGRTLDIDGVAQTEVNFKSKVLEWCQKNHLKLEFRMRDTHSIKPDDPDFDCVVLIEGAEAGFGKGFSKKESHQNAAREALSRIRNEQKFVSKLLKIAERRQELEKAEQETAAPKQPVANEKPARPAAKAAPAKTKQTPASEKRAEHAEKPVAAAEKPTENAVKQAEHAEMPMTAEAQPAEGAEKPKRSRSRRRPAKKAEGAQAETAEIPMKSEEKKPVVAEAQPSETVAEKPKRSRSRRRPARKTEAAAAENTGMEPMNAGAEPMKTESGAAE